MSLIDPSTRTATASRRWQPRFAVLGIMLCLLALQAAPALAKSTERSKQKGAVEAERAQLRDKLSALKRDISKTESAKDSVADTLAASEEAISNANRSLRDLAAEQSQTEAKMLDLSQQQVRLAQSVQAQQKRLALLLREQYVAGNEDRIKLLLSGDNPNRINRDLQYLGYVSQAQAKLIAALRADLQAIDANKEAAQNAKDELEEIAQETRDQKAVLEKEKGRRAQLLSQLSSKLAAQRSEAVNLQQNEQRLAGLVDKLAKLIEEQKKADALAQEKRRKEQEARALEQREKLARSQAEKEKRRSLAASQPKERTDIVTNRKASAGAAEPAEAAAKSLVHNEPVNEAKIEAKSEARNEAKNEQKNELTPEAGARDGAFASLRGQLRLPVKGVLAARFGSKRADGPSWKGLFIRAAEGAEVKAVASGRVVFAEWLRGFGNLIIVDHGSQYMTIYGNNHALFKQAGDLIKIGDTIASAGNSGGNEQSGLYFEMRHQGRAFDPLGWVTTR
jgi:murein hydrolase activator